VPGRLQPLPRKFYDRNAILVAPALVGCRVVCRGRVARIVETEAYVGEHDLACHARVGRTSRTEVMYGTPGTAYVYLIYGIHPMLNAVCGPGAAANAVLIRAAEPVLDGPDTEPWLHPSATGPGNLTKALGVSLRDNRLDLCDPASPLFIAPRRERAKPKLVRTGRVGVDYSGLWAQEPLRFCEADNRAVSRPRP
jgi:DNA-3-methyladenine glycosylase